MFTHRRTHTYTRTNTHTHAQIHNYIHTHTYMQTRMLFNKADNSAISVTMDVFGFDNMSYEVKGQNEECGVAQLSKEPAIFKDIHFGLCFIGIMILISKVKVDLTGQV